MLYHGDCILYYIVETVTYQLCNLIYPYHLPMDSNKAAALVTTRALGMKLAISGSPADEVRVAELALANGFDGTALLLVVDERVD